MIVWQSDCVRQKDLIFMTSSHLSPSHVSVTISKEAQYKIIFLCVIFLRQSSSITTVVVVAIEGSNGTV